MGTVKSATCSVSVQAVRKARSFQILEKTQTQLSMCEKADDACGTWAFFIKRMSSSSWVAMSLPHDGFGLQKLPHGPESTLPAIVVSILFHYPNITPT